MNEIFSGLEDFGFNNLNEIKLYDDENKEESQIKKTDEFNEENFLYDKTYSCPVCNRSFKARSVKIGKIRLVGKDTDLMPFYENINPLFYDVAICPYCGYGAMISYFDKLRSYQAELILKNITPKFKPKAYPNIYDVDIAIERFKYSLLICAVKNAKSSEKAYNCLKLSWMYRLKNDSENELRFLEFALIGFKEAFEKESFPICNMDQHTLMYLIGEIARRLGKNDEALLWFGKVIVSRSVKPRIKDMAREQKELIKNKGQL